MLKNFAQKMKLSKSYKKHKAIKFGAVLLSVLLTPLVFAQNSNEPKLSPQASICLSASGELGRLIDLKAMGATDRKLAEKSIDESNLPLQQKYRLYGLVGLLYAHTSEPSTGLNAKQIAIEYYLSCMNNR